MTDTPTAPHAAPDRPPCVPDSQLELPIAALTSDLANEAV